MSYLKKGLAWFALFISREQLSVNHLLIGAIVFSAFTEGRYIAASIIFVFGVIYLTAIDKIIDVMEAE